MATISCYRATPTPTVETFSGRLSLRGTETSLVILFDSEESLISITLYALDIRSLLPELETAIKQHAELLRGRP